MHTAVSNAINASVENFVSPFLEQAADAMDSASDVIERLPSAFLDKAFSKSLDVVTPFERMARWVAFVSGQLLFCLPLETNECTREQTDTACLAGFCLQQVSSCGHSV